MSSPIDQLLRSTRALNGDRLVLEAGKNALVWTAFGAKDVTKSPLTPYDVFKLISPIMPENRKVDLVGKPSTEFQYHLESVGTFNVTIIKESSGIKAVLKYIEAPTTPTQALPQARPLIMAQPLSQQEPPPPMAQPVKPGVTQPLPPTVRPIMAQPLLDPVPQAYSDRTAPLPQQLQRGEIPNLPTPPSLPSPHTQPPPQAVSTQTSLPSVTSAGTMSSRHQVGSLTDREKAKLELDKLLERAVKMKCSDLHLASGAPPIVRRLGSLIRLEADPLDTERVKLLIKEILTEEQFSRFDSTGDLDFSYELVGIGRFRGNVLRQYRGIDLTFHVVPADILPPEELGLPPLVRDLTRNHQGLILITGAAGQGKSTTISSLVDVINTERPLHIITIEDPIEFIHPINKAGVVNQREVGRHTLSYANALRAALREDPDVLVVGEMRDPETISLAITAAETGHLVMGTLMTSSAHQTVERILESFPPSQQNQIRTMLSESLRAVISQRLIPLADDSGMVLAAEILLGTPAVSNLIRDKKTFQIPSIMQTSRNIGMKRMDDALVELVQSGKITLQQAVEYALDKKMLESLARR